MKPVQWCVLTATVLGLPAQAATIQDGLWEFVVELQMPGAPAQEPVTLQQCLTQKSVKEMMGQLGPGGSCNITELREQGNRATWGMECSGQVAMSGRGDATFTRETFSGSMEMQIQMGDQSLPVTQSFRARRIGSCR